MRLLMLPSNWFISCSLLQSELTLFYWFVDAVGLEDLTKQSTIVPFSASSIHSKIFFNFHSKMASDFDSSWGA